jgi:DNA-binding NtrC family response regulator
MTVLLYVDDEEMIAQAVARWFGRLGYTVHLAGTIAAARRVLEVHSPDALFIDVWLGLESGFELMSWIQDARPELADRVTFVTGEMADPSRADRTWRSLGRPVLQKPFDFAQMQQLVTDAGERPRK